MHRYYLHIRNSGVFQTELFDQKTGLKLTARSTKINHKNETLLKIAIFFKTDVPANMAQKKLPMEDVKGIERILRAMHKADLNSDDALRIVQTLKEQGLISATDEKPGEGLGSFIQFLEEFWNYDSSPYIREKIAYGHSIGRRHCYESISHLKRYWKPVFHGRVLNSITRQDLKDLSLALSEKRLAPASINKVMAVGTTCLSWAFREGLIQADPTAGLVNFSGEAKKRGVLSPLEAQTLFEARWKDKRAYVANLLACTTGLRRCEILALRLEDIDESVLYVRHSWSPYDGLKVPKNGCTRKVPLLPEVRRRLLELAAENPHGTNGFVFHGNLADKPVDRSVLLNGLHNTLSSIGIDADERGIVFHSWRHYYAARMADRMTADQVSRVTGHKSRAVFDAYSDHITEKNLEEVGRIGAEVFGNLLQFRKGA